MQLNPYLNLDGRCKEAFEFYQQVLGGEIAFMQTYGDSPMRDQTPPEWHDKIIHTRLIVGGEVLMGSDAPPECYQKAQGISVTLNIDDPADAERIFHALAESGTVQIAIQETFWAIRFGMLVDQFGVPWMINCEKAA